MSARLRAAALSILARAAQHHAAQQQQQAARATIAAAAAAAIHAPSPPPPPLLRSRSRCFSSSSSPRQETKPLQQPQQQKEEDYSHLPGFTLAQVAQRDGISPDPDGGDTPPCWLAIDGLVIDATPYLNEHPGGADIIVLNAGTDASAEFGAVHTQAAREVLRRFVIGRLLPDDDADAAEGEAAAARAAREEREQHERATTGAPPPPAVALDPKRRVPMALASREWVSPTSVLLRFALPGGKRQRAGLPVGQHVMVYYRDDGAAATGAGGAGAGGESSSSTSGQELVARAYTPVSCEDSSEGTLDLLVRVYRPNDRFPKGGRLSQLLADAVSVEEGAVEAADGAAAPSAAPSSSSPRVEFKGPVGHFRYLPTPQGGRFSLANAPPRRASHLLLVAGGSGITPCYQVLRAALEEQARGLEEAPRRVALVYGSPCPEEILLKKELDDLARKHPSPAFSLRYTVDRVPGGEEAERAWRADGGSVGFVSREMLEGHGFLGRAGAEGEGEGEEEGERLALVCGPPIMLEKAVVPALRAMGFEGDRLVAF
jgi:nitrate reductase (NAD(P)H)